MTDLINTIWKIEYEGDINDVVEIKLLKNSTFKSVNIPPILYRSEVKPDKNYDPEFTEGEKQTWDLNDLLMNYGLNGLLLFSSALIITNKYSRVGLVLYFFSFTYLWLLCQGYFNNHYYLISILCFILIFNKVPFSKLEKIRVPYLNLFILKYFIVVVYFIAGLNKINPYWLVDLQPMTYILSKIGIVIRI